MISESEGMMKQVESKAELLQALKDKDEQITIHGTYADEVLSRYGDVLSKKKQLNVGGPAVLPTFKLGIEKYLERYQIESYKRKEELVLGQWEYE